MTGQHDDHRDAVGRESGHSPSAAPTQEMRRKGFLNPRTIELSSFITISVCIVGSVFVRILATLAVIAVGTAIFSAVNEKFGD